MVYNKIDNPAPPPQGNVDIATLQRHAVDIDFFLRNIAEKINNMSMLNHAVDVIEKTYGDRVSVSDKGKDLLKFGFNPNVGNSGRFTIWYTGKDQANETYVADNLNTIDSISSSSASDTQAVTIEGHTMTSGERTFVTQTVTLDGQNRVVLSTPLNRVTRVFHADLSSTNLVGEIYVYQNTGISSGKPIDTTKIHLTIPAGENQSQKASTSLSKEDYWIITQISAGNLQKTGSNIADVRLEVRNAGGVFKPRSKAVNVRTGENNELFFEPYLIIKPNSDIRLTANGTTTGMAISGDIHGFLAKIVGN